MKDKLEELLGKFADNCNAAMKTMPDKVESLKDELALIQKVLDAPNQPMRVNFDMSKIKKTEIKRASP